MKTELQQRAPAVALKLAEAEALLFELEAGVAPLALAESEGVSVAKRDLQALETKIDAAKRERQKLRSAHRHALELDQKADATAASLMRAEQFSEFRKHMASREKAMAAVLEAAATMAEAYARFSEASLSAAVSVPTGTSIPVMTIGPDGLYGHAFGPCGQLILSELFRLGPERADGTGRFVMAFAKPTIEALRHKPSDIPPGTSEFRAAQQAIETDIEKQVSVLDQRAMATAKDAA
jgi:hypothetical protein